MECFSRYGSKLALLVGRVGSQGHEFAPEARIVHTLPISRRTTGMLTVRREHRVSSVVGMWREAGRVKLAPPEERTALAHGPNVSTAAESRGRVGGGHYAAPR